MKNNFKTFAEIIHENDIFNDIDVSYLTESELKQSKEIYFQLYESYVKDGIPGIEEKIEEGILGTLAGFVIGPTIGRVIANALGIEKGILYDMLTSRLVSAALGNAIQNNMKK